MHPPFFGLLALLALALPAAKSQYHKVGSCRPDPHFVTFDGTYYDYQGVCDLLIVQNDDLNMLLHIRTEDQVHYSSISKAALKIGSDILEVKSDRTYAINGVASSTQSTIGGYALTITTTSSCSFCDPQIDFEVALSGGQFVRIQNWYVGLNVDVSAHASDFSNAVGMMGTWDNPGLIARDGTTSFDHLTETDLFASEWQVGSAPGDAILFSDPSSNPCTPSVSYSGIEAPGQGGTDEAENACRNIQTEGEKANCVFDVETTGDKVWAENPAYTKPVKPSFRCLDNKEMSCYERKGKCVWECDRDRFHCYEKVCELKFYEIKAPAKGSDNESKKGCYCAVPK